MESIIEKLLQINKYEVLTNINELIILERKRFIEQNKKDEDVKYFRKNFENNYFPNHS